MSATLLLVQALNGLQLGILLFLLAAGLTLVFGIMNFINLAHGSLYMMGAFIAATVFRHSGSFLLAAAAVVAGMALLGLLLDRVSWRGSIRASTWTRCWPPSASSCSSTS